MKKYEAEILFHYLKIVSCNIDGAMLEDTLYDTNFY
jgi:hypothetical protein